MKKNKLAANLIQALLITLALSFTFQIVDMSDKGGFLVNFVSKLPLVFKPDYFVDFMIFLGSYFLIDRFCENEKPDKMTIVVSGLFAVIYVICQSYKYYGNMSLFVANTFQLFMALVTVLGFWSCFYLFMSMLMTAIDRANVVNDSKTPSPEKMFWISFGVIIFCYIVWSLLNYPGTFNPDAQQQIDQVLGNTEWENVHPPFGSIIMGGLYKLGYALGSAALGVYFYILLQNVVCACAFAYAIKKMYVWGAGKNTCIWTIVFFAINPFWLTYAQLYNKDQLYVGIMTFLTITIAEIVKKRELSVEDIIKLSALSLIAALLRKNGIYSIVPTVFLMIFIIKKIDRKKLIGILVGFILVYELVNKALYPACGIKDGSIREALSIPFQQTANYVKYYGNDVTAEEKSAIDAVLEYDSLAENYTPYISSPVKDTYREDSSKLPAYFSVWFKMFFKHPESYMNAFMGQYYCYMAPVYSDLAGVDIEATKWDKKREINHIGGNGPLFVKQIKKMAEQAPLVKYLGDPGIYTWLLILATVLLIKKRKYAECIFLVPNIINLLVCFASPANGSSRYALPLIAMAPLYLFWVVRNYKDETDV